VVNHDRTAHRFFLLLLAAVVVLLALVVRPLASALLMAATLAAVLAPVHGRLTKRLRGRAGLAAGLLVAAVIVVLVGPLLGLAAFLLKEGSEAMTFLSDTASAEGVRGLLAKLPDSLERLATAGMARVSSVNELLEKQLRAQGGKAAATVWAALTATGSMAFGAAMMLIALYFLLAEGGDLAKWFDSALPLRRGQTRELLAEFKKVSFSVIVSAIATSAVQAVAALAGFLIARLPHPIFFAAVTFFTAFIPAIGAASVCIVGGVILYATGHPGFGIFLAAWGVAVVGLADNVVKPMLIKIGMEMRSAVVFFALIGGLGAFGAIGLVIGPLVVALFLALIRIYRRDYRDESDDAHEGDGQQPRKTAQRAPHRAR
jgi:predicted PurR-regulated permease PerM